MEVESVAAGRRLGRPQSGFVRNIRFLLSQISWADQEPVLSVLTRPSPAPATPIWWPGREGEGELYMKSKSRLGIRLKGSDDVDVVQALGIQAVRWYLSYLSCTAHIECKQIQMSYSFWQTDTASHQSSHWNSTDYY